VTLVDGMESERGGVVTTPTSQATKRLTPLLPKRFGFVGWTRTTPTTTPSDCHTYYLPHSDT